MKKSFIELTEGITCFEDICIKKGDNAEDILPFKSPINARQMAANDREVLDYIAEYLQDGFKADYSDINQWKWSPWFLYDKNSSAFVFAGSHCDFTFAIAGVGSRLSFPTEEISDFFGKIFIELHNRWLLNKY